MTVILDVLSIFWQLEGSLKIKLSILGFLLKHAQGEKLRDTNKDPTQELALKTGESREVQPKFHG